MEIEARIRRFVKNAYAKGLETLRLTQFESQAIAMVEDPKIEVTRAGRRFHGGNQIIANGIAPVTAIPTTTATLALFNAEDPGGMALCIDKVNFWLGSGTPTAGATLLATVSTKKIATPPSAMATGYGLQSASGSTRTSKALWTTAVTLPSPPVPAWHALISTFQLAAANVGQGDGWIELNGGLIVPPGYAAGFAILSGTGTAPLYGVSASWTELELELE